MKENEGEKDNEEEKESEELMKNEEGDMTVAALREANLRIDKLSARVLTSSCGSRLDHGER